MRKFINMCKKTQKQLKSYLARELVKYGYEVIDKPGFLYARGIDPVLVTAHMDTVHEKRVKRVVVKETNGNHLISSPQGIGGDDRCGCYMILEIIEQGKRPYVLFCEDEEMGGVGSGKFCRTKYVDELSEMKFLIELDRCSANDAVFYEDDNEDFHYWIEDTIGYKENFGSFSDISTLCPSCGIAGVNLSCGYYKQHTTDEYVVFEEMKNTIKATIKLIDKADKQFEYIEYKYSRYDNWYFGYNERKERIIMEFEYIDEFGNENWDCTEGKSTEECIGIFLVANPTIRWTDVIDYFEYI